jgi:hypothetical protein
VIDPPISTTKGTPSAPATYLDAFERAERRRNRIGREDIAIANGAEPHHLDNDGIAPPGQRQQPAILPPGIQASRRDSHAVARDQRILRGYGQRN